MLLKTQSNYIQYTDNLRDLISPLSVINEKTEGQKENFLEIVERLKQDISQSELIVPVVGGFSSGKSSLINSFLGRSILPVGIQPETALAAELRYSEQEYVEAIGLNGKVDKYNLSDFEVIKQKASEYEYMKVYLNNQNLKDIQPLVLVDMPGFSSPVAGHDKAIINYNRKGVYFVFLTAVDSGGNLQSNIIREINRLNKIGKGFSFCLSKINTKAASAVIEIKDYIIEQLEDEFDEFNDEIILLDANGGENLKRIIQSIQPEALFKKLFQERLQDNLSDIQSYLSRTVENLKLGEEEQKREIEKIMQCFKRIEQKKDAAIKDIASKNIEDILELIITSTLSEIKKHDSVLADTALVSESRFKEDFNALVRDSLDKVLQREIKLISNEIVKDFELEARNIDLGTIDTSFIEEIKAKIQRDLDKPEQGIDLTKGIEILKNISSFIPGIGLIVNKVLNIATAILKVFNIGSSSDLEQRNAELRAEFKRQEAKERVKTFIHSQFEEDFRAKTESNIKSMLKEVLEKMTTTIAEAFEQELKQEQASKENSLKQHQSNRENVAQEIELLNGVNTRLDSLKSQYLN